MANIRPLFTLVKNVIRDTPYKIITSGIIIYFGILFFNDIIFSYLPFQSSQGPYPLLLWFYHCSKLKSIIYTNLFMILRIVDLSNNYFLYFKYIYLTRITAIFTIIRKLLIRFMPHSISSSILLAIASSFTKYMDRISIIYLGILCLAFLSIKTCIIIASIEKIINSTFVSISLSSFHNQFYA